MPETPPKSKASQWDVDQQVFPPTPQKPHIPTVAFEQLDSEYINNVILCNLTDYIPVGFPSILG